MFKIRINEFCGISRNKIWQSWLESTAPDLHQQLIVTVTDPGGGCKKNTAAMVDIYNTLVRRGHEKILLDFLKKEFPVALEEVQKNVFQTTETEKDKKIDPKVYNDIGEPNKHKIFKSYNPNILTFPQKMIIIDPNTFSLNKKVRNFIKDKIDADFLIIEDRAYIEYFLSKYRQEASKYPQELRELYQWRKTNM